MKRKATFFIGLFLLILLTMTVFAADPEIKFSGYAQTWFSYAQLNSDTGDDNAYVFSLRRVRFKPYGSLSDKIKWSLQVGWDSHTAGLIEVYLDYLFAKGFNLRIGQFSVPGAPSGSITSSADLDLLERSMITEKWGSNNTLSAFRALGVQLSGTFLHDKLFYAVMVANPKAINLTPPKITSSTYSNQNSGLYLWARIEAKPLNGLRLGAFYGSGKEEDTQVKKNSYGAHLFYVKDAINFKAEYIAGEYGPAGVTTQYDGMYALLGYKIKKFEPIVRYGIYTPNNDQPDAAMVEEYQDLTFGLNYFYSNKIKLQVNYMMRNETMSGDLEELKNNIFYICFQFGF